MISRIIQTSVYVIRLSFASADNIDLGLNNSWYHAQPHPIIAYCLLTDKLAIYEVIAFIVRFIIRIILKEKFLFM
jgi:hypothetical protein